MQHREPRRGDLVARALLVLLIVALAWAWVAEHRWSNRGSDRRAELERVELGHLETLGLQKLRESASNGLPGWEGPSVTRVFDCGACGDDLMPRIDELAAATGWKKKPGSEQNVPSVRYYIKSSYPEYPSQVSVYVTQQTHEVQVSLYAPMPANP